MIYLSSPSLSGSPFHLEKRRTLIGNDPRNDYQAREAYLSDFHLQIHQGQKLRVISTSGHPISINGQETEAAYPSLPCLIEIGETRFILTREPNYHGEGLYKEKQGSATPPDLPPSRSIPPPLPSVGSPIIRSDRTNGQPQTSSRQWKFAKILVGVAVIFLIFGALPEQEALTKSPDEATDPSDSELVVWSNEPTLPLQIEEEPNKRPSSLLRLRSALQESSRKHVTIPSNYLHPDFTARLNLEGGIIRVTSNLTFDDGHQEIIEETALATLRPMEFEQSIVTIDETSYHRLAIPSAIHPRRFTEPYPSDSAIPETHNVQEVILLSPTEETALSLIRGLNLLQVAANQSNESDYEIHPRSKDDESLIHFFISELQRPNSPTPTELIPQKLETSKSAITPNQIDQESVSSNVPHKEEAPSPKGAKIKFSKLAQDFLRGGSSNSSINQSAMLASTVNYFDKVRTKNEVVEDMKKHEARWTTRTYSPNPSHVVMGNDDTASIYTWFTFKCENDDKISTGKFRSYIKAIHVNGSYYITSVNSDQQESHQITEKKSPEKTRRRINEFGNLAQRFLIAGSSNQRINQSEMLASKVSYFGKTRTRDQAISDILSYRRKWPIRTYRPEDSRVVLHSNTSATITTWFTFKCENNTQISTGKFRSLMKATFRDGEYFITSVNSDQKKFHHKVDK